MKNSSENNPQTKANNQTIKSHNNIDFVDRLLIFLSFVGAILIGAFGSDQLHFLMVLFTFLTVFIALIDLFRHATFKRRWYVFVLLSFIIFLFCSFWEIQHSKPVFFFTSQKPKTLLDLFKTDFSRNLGWTADRNIVLTLENKESITIIAKVWYDYEAQSFFIGFYIPNTPHTYLICTHLVDNYTIALDIKNSIRAELWGPGTQPINSNELKFTGRIFIYHESPLYEEQRRELYAMFKSKRLTPQFRDQQHVSAWTKSK